MQTYVNKIMDRIIENTDTTTNVGMIIASPSNDPPYKYHWIRDSALVMRPIIDMYKQTKEPIYFQHIINYLENESKIQKLQTLTGLGEPKININGTPFDEPWGRPQNDGPALRGIICCSLIECFQYKYDTLIETLIVPMIQKDIEYTLANYDKPCFDLWEEHMGWHFYTRMVQLKFIKQVEKYNRYFDKHDTYYQYPYQQLMKSIKDHFNGETIISSFDTEGNIVKYEDSANILAFTHISYDRDILQEVPIHYVMNTCDNLILYFREKYKDDSLNLIGRYKHDKYYDGQIWIICSLALAQVLVKVYQIYNTSKDRSPMHRSKSNPNNNTVQIANEILERILTLDTDFILPEQFNPNTNEFLSAKKLTWNYSELYQVIRLLK
jgi:glucoamylase